ncbi:MAG: hypothetical protein H6748_19175 [Spirochaetaceae bacterium]|nr:hypothetical protein [Spirochaetaceae bacterium]
MDPSVRALEMLTALGFGPDTLLMNDPKLFVDGRFLASLLVELEDELGERDAALALFQIGLLHGLRDAARMCGDREEAIGDGRLGAPDTTALVLRWSLEPSVDREDALAVRGQWPEHHEAQARCARLGVASSPACWMSAGYTSGWLSGSLGRNLLVREVECAATGAASCCFEALEAEDWATRGDATMEWLVDHVPFTAFRAIAVRPAGARSAHDPIGGGARDGGFDRSQAVVHIWGPVMVLPFTTLDEALGTVEMLGRDPGISEIRTVVVDLREQPLDEGFGAAALEQVLETIESWDAQSLITGIAPSAEAAMASLESSHLVLRKDLSEAIATAFQIADAQRHRI